MFRVQGAKTIFPLAFPVTIHFWHISWPCKIQSKTFSLRECKLNTWQTTILAFRFQSLEAMKGPLVTAFILTGSCSSHNRDAVTPMLTASGYRLNATHTVDTLSTVPQWNEIFLPFHLTDEKVQVQESNICQMSPSKTQTFYTNQGPIDFNSEMEIHVVPRLTLNLLCS